MKRITDIANNMVNNISSVISGLVKTKPESTDSQFPDFGEDLEEELWADFDIDEYGDHE